MLLFTRYSSDFAVINKHNVEMNMYYLNSNVF